MRLPGRSSLTMASLSPWEDDGHRQMIGVGWHRTEVCESTMTPNIGIVRMELPGGTVLDSIDLDEDPLPNGTPCWLPGILSRIVYPGADGRIYRLDFETAARRRCTASDRGPATRASLAGLAGRGCRTRRERFMLVGWFWSGPPAHCLAPHQAERGVAVRVAGLVVGPGSRRHVGRRRRPPPRNGDGGPNGRTAIPHADRSCRRSPFTRVLCHPEGALGTGTEGGSGPLRSRFGCPPRQR